MVLQSVKAVLKVIKLFFLLFSFVWTLRHTFEFQASREHGTFKVKKIYRSTSDQQVSASVEENPSVSVVTCFKMSQNLILKPANAKQHTFVKLLSK